MARNGPTPVWTSARKKFNQSKPRSVRAEGVTLRPKARRRRAVEPHHVLHQLQTAVSLGSQDRLRMKLHGFHRQLAVAQAHDDAVIRLGSHFQARRETPPPGDQRMIAPHLKTLRQSLEHARAGAFSGGPLSFAV